MRVSARLVVVALLAGCVGPPAPPVDHGSFEDVRRIVAALDDVAGEYPRTVADGAVVDPVRQRVLDHLLHDAARYATHLTVDDRAPLAALTAALAAHAEPAVVVAAANRLRRTMLARRGLVLAPAAPPSRPRAEALWRTLCAGCHGEVGVGDGPQGLYLEPEPKNFHEPTFILGLAPSRAFSRIADGVPGTAMPSWGIPSTSERWGLAALVFGFRHGPAAVARGRALADRAAPLAAWTALADRTDAEVLAGLLLRGLAGADADAVLAYLRAEVAFAPIGGRFGVVRAALARGLAAYQARRWDEARGSFRAARHATLARLDAVRAVDRARAAALEVQLARLTSTVAAGALEEDVAHELVRAQALLDDAEATAAPTGADGAGLARERAALATLALAVWLAAWWRRPDRGRGAWLALAVGGALGAGLGGALAPASLPLAVALLSTAAALALAGVAPRRVANTATGGVLALAVALPIAGTARALTVDGGALGATSAALATATLAAAIVALVAALRPWPRLAAAPWLRAGTTGGAAAALAGHGAWQWWTLDGGAATLWSYPTVAALGLYPARAALLVALLAAAAAALAGARLTLARGAGRPGRAAAAGTTP